MRRRAPMTAVGHFETNGTRYRCAAIGLVLLHELTFCTLHQSPHIVVNHLARHCDVIGDLVAVEAFPETSEDSAGRILMMVPCREPLAITLTAAASARG